MLRRLLLAVLAAILLLPPVAQAKIPKDKIKIGVLQNLPAPFAAETGNGGIVAAQMAAGDFETMYLRGDAEILPGASEKTVQDDIAQAKEWLDKEDVAAIVSSAGPLVDQQLARLVEQHHRTLLIAATDEGVNPKLCSPDVVVWGATPDARARVLAQTLVPQGNDRWFVLTSETPVGLMEQAALHAAVTAAGGQIVGKLDHVVGQADMRKALPKIDQADPQVVALVESEGDLIAALRTAALAGVPYKTTLVAPFAQINEVEDAGLTVAQGMLVVTPFYWDSNQHTRDFARRWSRRMRSRHVTVNAATVYAATFSFLNAAKAAESIDADKVLAQLRAKPLKDTLLGTVTLRKDGRVLSDLGVYRVKAPNQVQYRWDYYTKVATIPGAKAYPPGACGG